MVMVVLVVVMHVGGSWFGGDGSIVVVVILGVAVGQVLVMARGVGERGSDGVVRAQCLLRRVTRALLFRHTVKPRVRATHVAGGLLRGGPTK